MVAEGQLLDPDGGGAEARRRSAGRGRRRRPGAGLEDTAGGLQAAGAGVEGDADAPQWQVYLGGEDEHRQPGPQTESAPHQADADGDRQQGDAEAGQQLQDQGGEKGDPQGGHRLPPEPRRNLADALNLLRPAAEDPQRRQPLEDVEEMTSEQFERAPPPLRPALRHPSDDDHEQWDERHGRRQDQGRHPVHGEDVGDGQQGHGGTHQQLGNEAGEVGVEAVQSAGQVGRGLAAAPSADDHRTLGQRGAEALDSHLRDDARGAVVADALGQPYQRRPQSHDRGERPQRLRHLRQPGARLEDVGDDRRQQHRPRDHAETLEHSARADCDHRPARRAPAQQPGVDPAHVLSGDGLRGLRGAGRWNSSAVTRWRRTQ
jgi:hypothetical protein